MKVAVEKLTCGWILIDDLFIYLAGGLVAKWLYHLYISSTMQTQTANIWCNEKVFTTIQTILLLPSPNGVG